MDIISELMNTLLPVPVEPAISKCGIAAKSVTRMRPCKSRPIARVSLLGELRNSGASMISRSAMVWRLMLGPSIPMVDLAGIDLRHAALDIEFQALVFDGARANLQFVFIELLAARAFAQQGNRRQLVIGAALGDFRLARFLGGNLFFLLRVEKQDGNLAGIARLFVVFFRFT